ncbi:hypothetical protein LQ327_21090 [Actinomycetospora endophytica]|uniref:Uncharacterized protein n=1 Tax=Actinomycetospora endophytica TaxID=2291215 RepID=A0ABS8PC95_9PSEU|nr:hypothetical protein [Actinomycetospora endophytica]MCD2195871.1 hypothetical protein [Actinomycetospora endophytica]
MEVADRVPDVAIDEIGVDGDGRRGSGAGGADDLSAGVDDVAGGPETRCAAASPRQHQGRRQTSRTPADDRYVVIGHAARLAVP